jgi:phage/plasmid-like protein (TIGR03299 family)
MRENRVAIWRPDERKILGTASPGYQVIPNQRLLDFASALREEVDMDTVVVLRGGAKVAFTAKIRGATKDVLPGDTVNLNFVGYLGHDGKTALGAMLTPVRVVCANTLGFAMTDADRNNKHMRIRHNTFEIGQIDSLIGQIDLGRQQLPTVITEMQMLQSKAVTYDGFRHYLERVYSLPPVQLPDGDTRPASVEDMPRRWAQLKEAWNYGLGHDIPGVANTAWAAFNAVTQVESSTKTAGAGLRRTHSALFGTGKSVIQRARELAIAL